MATRVQRFLLNNNSEDELHGENPSFYNIFRSKSEFESYI